MFSNGRWLFPATEKGSPPSQKLSRQGTGSLGSVKILDYHHTSRVYEYCVCPASSRRSGRHCGAASLRNNYVPSRSRTMGTGLSCQDASDHVVSPYDEHLRILLNFGASEREAREALAKYSGDALIPVAVRNHSSCARAPCYSRFGLCGLIRVRGVG